MPPIVSPHPFDGEYGDLCGVCGFTFRHVAHKRRVNAPLALVLLERAQDGYVNPTGGKTTGRERKGGA